MAVMWKFLLSCTIFMMLYLLHCIPFCSATCTPEQLDVSQIQHALDKCRKTYFGYGETQPLRTGTTTSSSTTYQSPKYDNPVTIINKPKVYFTTSTLLPRETVTTEELITDISHPINPIQATYLANPQDIKAITLSQVYPLLMPPAATDNSAPIDHVTLSSIQSQLITSISQFPPLRLTNLNRRTPRSFRSLRNDATLPHATLKLERGSWGVGANDKKCVFYCAYVELGLMDEEGRLVEGQLRRLLENSARSPELKARAGELVELCQYKMLHVSTIDPAQMECDFPLMLTRCVLGRLSKHCEAHTKNSKQTLTMHPDVELL